MKLKFEFNKKQMLLKIEHIKQNRMLQQIEHIKQKQMLEFQQTDQMETTSIQNSEMHSQLFEDDLTKGDKTPV